MAKYLFIYLLIIFSFDAIWCQLSCKDEYNSPVDWFIALKYPNSYDFVYLTPNITKWKKSSTDLSSSKNMVGLTLQQSYDPKYFYAYYNDEPIKFTLRQRYENEKGHLKGVVNFGQATGYWLIHSVPKFPSEGKYAYLKGERRFGQSFICVSIGSKDLQSIVLQLLMMYPEVYSHNIPDGFTTDPKLMKSLDRLVKNKKTNISDTGQLIMDTINHQLIHHFGKAGSFGRDLYADYMATGLRTSIYVETWIRNDRINSSCNSLYKVYNVNKVNLTDEIFKEAKDNSKWAVSTSADKPYVCIGDINRMTSQFVRGGGSMCMSNIDVWSTYKNVVSDYEKCDGI